MRRPRFTIAWWMRSTAVLAVIAALVRAFVVPEELNGGTFIVIALLVGLWCLLRSRGRARRFWLGFELAGVVATLAVSECDVFPDSALARLLLSYSDIAINLAESHLPQSLANHLDEYGDQLLAVVYFMPVLAVALLGGMIAASLVRTGQKPARTVLPEERPSLLALPHE